MLASLPLALSMGAAEWMLIWFRRRTQRLLRSTRDLRVFAVRARLVLLGALLQYLAAAVVLTAVVSRSRPGPAVHLHATVLPQLAVYLALGGAMFVALLLQAFGNRVFPLTACAVALAVRSCAAASGPGPARGLRASCSWCWRLRGPGAGERDAACLIRRLDGTQGTECQCSPGGEVSMTDQVAVTGAEGFIGSHLVEVLVRRGYRVRAMVLYNMYSSRGWLDTLAADVLDQVEVVFGDVRDPASVRGLVEGAAVVYHLAALGSVPYSYAAPRSFVDTNVIGTLHVLEAVRACRTPRLVHTSTSETYGTARTVPISEAHVLQAQSPYAASKIAADKLVESYYLSFGTPAVTLRPFNTFGPRQSARAVIPAVIIQLAAGSRQLKLGALDSDPGFLLRHRHRPGVRGPGRGAGLGGARGAVQRRPGDRRGDRPARRGHRRTHGRGGGHRRGFPAAAPEGLGGDAAGLRCVQAARPYRMAAAGQPGRRAAPDHRVVPASRAT